MEMMNETRRAALIFDNGTVGADLDEVLRHAGFVVVRANAGQLDAQLLAEAGANLIVVGGGLPDIDAHEIIRRLRPQTKAHIMLITDEADEFDVVLALEAGADQYMIAPVSLREFRARVNAILRLQERLCEQPNGETQTEQLRHGELLLNTSTWDVSISGQVIPVTATEFSLLHVLMLAPGKVRSKQEMVRHTNGYDEHNEGYISAADERSIEVHIANLRRKLGDSARNPRWIETVRGVGYRLVIDHKLVA